VRVHTFEGHAAITLAVGELAATVLPSLGLLGVSLRRGTDEYLSLAGGVDGYVAGHVTGLPLLAPWANRLAGDEYRVGTLTVDLSDVPHLHRDPNGLPMHGTLIAEEGWEVVRLATDARSAVMVSRLDVGARPDLLASFPFPHELTVEHRLDATALSVATTVRATGRRRVPVSFGWHPYLRIPGARRGSLRIGMPARRHLELDERSIPTGVGVRAPAEEAPLGSRSYDDLYALGRDRRVSLAAGDRALRLLFDRNYGFLQVYAPPEQNFCCLEPMTAPTNALASGSCPLVSPGQSFTARFSISPVPAPREESA
jgi:galactose mutarotase-like enzyme